MTGFDVVDDLRQDVAKHAAEFLGRRMERRVNITVLVGNGFDLGLGLDTRYEDFLKRYMKPSYPVVTDAIKKMREEIASQTNDDQKCWANAELAFAQLRFSEYGHAEGAVGAFAECEGDFVAALKDYLLDEDARFYVPASEGENVRRQFIGQMLDMVDCVLPEIKSNKLIDLKFINFNYTSTLARMLSQNENGSELRLKLSQGPEIHIGIVRHVHGSLRLRDILFGVDDSEQIGDDELRQISQERGYLQKTSLDADLGINELSSSLAEIKQSDIVVLFGLSYGASDFIFWQQIIESLKSQPMQKVVMVGYYKDPPVVDGAAMRVKLQNDERDRFARALSDRFLNFRIDKYADRISVVGNDYFKDPEGQMVYGDPLALGWFGRRFVHK